jgi:hypothetical protein
MLQFLEKEKDKINNTPILRERKKVEENKGITNLQKKGQKTHISCTEIQKDFPWSKLMKVGICN